MRWNNEIAITWLSSGSIHDPISDLTIVSRLGSTLANVLAQQPSRSRPGEYYQLLSAPSQAFTLLHTYSLDCKSVRTPLNLQWFVRVKILLFCTHISLHMQYNVLTVYPENRNLFPRFVGPSLFPTLPVLTLIHTCTCPLSVAPHALIWNNFITGEWSVIIFSKSVFIISMRLFSPIVLCNHQAKSKKKLEKISFVYSFILPLTSPPTPTYTHSHPQTKTLRHHTWRQSAMMVNCVWGGMITLT